PLFADGPGLPFEQLSAAFFLAPVAAALWAWRAARRERPGVHAALAIWAVVTLFLALSQRLNVYYAAPLAALTLVETVRVVAARARRPILAGVLGLALALPMVPGLRRELANVRPPGSDFFETLSRMREQLPHAIDAYDPALLGPPPFPAALSGASS